MAVWQDLIAVAFLDTGWVTPARMGARQFAVFHTETGIHVTAALCSHAGADLCQGYFADHRIECPLHQGLFDVRTGAAIGAPATRPIRRFPARVAGDMVQIQI